MSNRDPDPRISVLMAIVGNFALADRCVESIFRYTKAPFVLLLGDNATGTGGLEYFEKWSKMPNTVVIRNERLIQHGEVIDILLEHVKTPYFVLMDSDTELLSENWLEELLGGFENDPLVMESGPDFVEHRENYLAPMENRVVRYTERFGPWLLMYRTDVKEICRGVSFVFQRDVREENGRVKHTHWDTGGRVHWALKEKGYHYRILPKSYKRNYLHHGGIRWRSEPDRLEFAVITFARKLERRCLGSTDLGAKLYNTARKIGIYD